MFKTFAAALVATAMVAGAAVAAAPSTDAGTPPSTVTAGGSTKTEAMPARAHKPMKRVSHMRKHVTKHFGTKHFVTKYVVTKHLASAKHHRTRAVHNVSGRQAHKSAKVTKVGTPAKTAKVTKTAKAVGVQPAKLPASRIN
jgi:hypothetical protein